MSVPITDKSPMIDRTVLWTNPNKKKKILASDIFNTCTKVSNPLKINLCLKNDYDILPH